VFLTAEDSVCAAEAWGVAVGAAPANGNKQPIVNTINPVYDDNAPFSANGVHGFRLVHVPPSKHQLNQALSLRLYFYNMYRLRHILLVLII